MRMLQATESQYDEDDDEKDDDDGDETDVQEHSAVSTHTPLMRADSDARRLLAVPVKLQDRFLVRPGEGGCVCEFDVWCA